MDRILIIENDQEILQKLTNLLHYEGYEIIKACDGADGLAIAISQRTDLILCDVLLPKKNGYEVLTELKQNIETCAIPFLFLTSRTDINSHRIGMNLGADDYIHKPINDNELINAINVRLEKSSAIRTYYNKRIEEFRKNLSVALPHELRTPLNTILGFAQILKTDGNDLTEDEKLDMIDSIENAGHRLLRLTINYSYYTKLIHCRNNGGFGSCECISQPARELLDTARCLSTKYQRQGDIVLNLKDHPVFLPMEYFRKMSEEILDNSLKFSEKGSKVFIDSGAKGDCFYFSVEDNGSGFRPEHIDEIGAFVQFDRKYYEQQGIGLGLSIASTIAETAGGEFKIYSKKNSHTKITVRLPSKPSQ
jgi:K+-sensing histidine kinase KdpD